MSSDRMRETAPAAEPRAACLRCGKPRVTCICASVPRVRNRTPLWIVQHPRERFHPIGTARFAELGLERVRLDVAFRGSSALAPPRPIRPGTCVLYPDPAAPELSALAPERRPTELVVIDGTWHHARTLLRDLPWLGALPRVRWTPDAPSRYRIRREPRAECVSTLEAIVAALRIVEPETEGLDDLLVAFDAMIDQQLGYVRAGAGRRTQHRRPASLRRLPRALGERFADLLVVYAESLADGGRRRLVQVTATRPSTGESLDLVVAGAWSPALRHTLLDPADLGGGLAPSAVAAAWRRLRRPTDLIAAWNQSTLDALRAASLEPQGLLLKGVYAARTRTRPGTLEAVVDREGLTFAPLPLRGRAAERLAAAAAVARRLAEQPEHAPGQDSQAPVFTAFSGSDPPALSTALAPGVPSSTAT